jgi:hypothetical protein
MSEKELIHRQMVKILNEANRLAESGFEKVPRLLLEEYWSLLVEYHRIGLVPCVESQDQE